MTRIPHPERDATGQAFERLVLSVLETAITLSISTRSVHRLLAAKELEAIKCGRATRVSVKSIHEFLKRGGTKE